MLVTVTLATILAACADDSPRISPLAPSLGRNDRVGVTNSSDASIVRQLAASRGVVPLQVHASVRPALVRLGQMLAFDRILSGNRDIACATCHLPAFGTGDGKSLSIGQGGEGLGPARGHPNGTFIPRNAPSLFNLSAAHSLFWDGRVADDGHGGVTTPAGAQITPGMQRAFEFGPVSALAMFPVTNRAEMRAVNGNELAEIADGDNPAIWRALMKRLGAIPEYRELFRDAYPGKRFDELTFAHASNAIAAFFVQRLTFNNSPWDRFLAGDDRALSERQLAGAKTFLTLKCSICHNGSTFSDGKFHGVAVAQIGPGEGNGVSLRDDLGRMNVTGNPSDRYLFRTTPLRNVEFTGPYGHDGVIASLRGFIEHYSESDKKLRAFDPSTLELPLRLTMVPNIEAVLAQRDTLLNGVVLTDDLVDKLVDYMTALSDPAARNLSYLTPSRVPSGLRVPRP